jgi:putative sigma-54 modulation protein
MPVIVKGKNIEVTDALRKYAEEKLNHAKKHFNEIIKTEIEFIVEKNPSIAKNQTVEVTLFTKGPLFRAKESSTDMYASIDLVVEKLEKQIDKFKGKTYKSQSHPAEAAEVPAPEISEEETGEVGHPLIVEVRRVPMKPMSPEEAIMQMQLLGQEFFVFTNAETEETNVVYRKKNNTFGLIEPVF